MQDYLQRRGEMPDARLRELVPHWLCDAASSLQRRGALVRCLSTLLGLLFLTY